MSTYTEFKTKIVLTYLLPPLNAVIVSEVDYKQSFWENIADKSHKHHSLPNPQTPPPTFILNSDISENFK